VFDHVISAWEVSGDTNTTFLQEVRDTQAKMDKGIHIGWFGQIQGISLVLLSFRSISLTNSQNGKSVGTNQTMSTAISLCLLAGIPVIALASMPGTKLSQTP
jgi:hypothetical protein